MDTLLAEAAELLAATTNLNVTYTYDQEKNDRGTDGHLTITNGQQKYTWGVELKKRLLRQVLAKLTLVKTVLHDEKALIIAPYINEKLAELCREMQVDYLDLAGNAHLNNPPIYIDIRGRKPPP
ncbi:MAG: hypothetical protein CL592_04510, partial [Alteromonas sp.]|nr:hypothetical protein [Alteromonas sp.]